MKHDYLKKLITGFIILLIFAGPARTELLESVCQFNIHDRYYSNSINGDYMYFATQGGIDIFTISDSASLSFEKRIPLTGTNSIYIKDDIAYLTGKKFVTLDLNDPLNPEIQGVIQFDFGSTWQIGIDNNYAFTVSSFGFPPYYSNSIIIIDVSSLQNPHIATSISDGNCIAAFDIDSVYNRLAVEWYDWDIPGLEAVRIYDISIPLSPVCIDSFPFFCYEVLQDFALMDNYIFSLLATTSNSYLHVYDINLHERIDSLVIQNPTQIEIIDDIAYVRQESGFTIIDVSDPNNCFIEGSYNSDFYSLAIGIQDTIVYCINNILESEPHQYRYLIDIQSINISDPGNCRVINEYHAPDENYTIQIKDNYGFVANKNRGIIIYDLIDPSHPELVNSITTNTQISHLDIENTMLYFSDHAGNFYIYDIANPAVPLFISRIDSIGEVTDMHIENNIAFLLAEPVVYIFDISEPSQVDTLSIIQSVSYPKYICVNDDALYINDNNIGMAIFDISDLSEPIYQETYQFQYDGYEIEVYDDIAYVGLYRRTMEIIDVRNPMQPNLIGTLNTIGTYSNVSIYDGLLFLSKSNRTLIFDLAVPESPVLLDSIECYYSTPGSLPVAKVLMQDSLIYVPTANYVEILRFTPTGIEQAAEIPMQFTLSPNFPNPFNASTTISYTLPERTEVMLDIYDILGRKVTTLIDRRQSTGYHQAIWRADDLASGMYFYKLQAGEYSQSKKMLLMK